MKKAILLTLTSLLSVFVISQTVPDFGIISPIKINLKSGINQIIVPQVTDADAGVEQDITFTATSSDLSIIEIFSVEYSKGNNIAILNVREKNKPGTSTLSIKATDADGEFSRNVSVNVGSYDFPGIKFEIHDIVFWKQEVPIDGTPVWDTIIQSGLGPWAQLNWANIPITVNADCKNSPPCMGYDFFTAFYRGYLVPSVSANYTFYIKNQDQKDLWISTDDKHVPSRRIIFSSTDAAKVIGTDMGSGEFKSAPISLEAGKVYAIHATQWIVHTMSGGIQWEATGAGIAKQYIPGANMMPVYDTIRPVAVKNLKLVQKSSTELMIAWDKTTDNKKVNGYNIYLDGVKVNVTPVDATSYTLDGLTNNTFYNVVVTAKDDMGNESLVSNILSETTYPTDAISPIAPTSISLVQASAEALKIRWSGATDAQTAVIAYNVFVDDVKYNSSYLYADSLIIWGLKPLTTYKIEVVAFDASYNASAKSSAQNFKTLAFDPTGISLGEKRARMKIYMENISWTEGIGINPPFTDGSLISNATLKKVVEDFHPGTIRWGALDANPLSLAASSGTGKSNTYARMLNFANEMGSLFSLTIGVKDGLDYRTDSATFLNLLEYLAGPSTSTWGAKRAAEGFTAPLLQNSKGIILEFGNEVWGAASHNAEIGANYTQYGKWCRDMAHVLKKSPYYDPNKIILTYSGRNPHPNDSYGLNRLVMTGDTGEFDCLAVSGYMGGNMNYDQDVPQGETEGEYYQSVMAKFAFNIEGFKKTMGDDMLKYTGEIKKFYLYEANTTTSAYNGRLGQAIMATDYYVTGMKYGSIAPSIFHLTGGEWKITKPAESYKPLGLYLTAQLFNKYAKGHVLKTEIETNDVIKNVSGSVLAFDPVGAHAFCDGTNYAIVLFSRDFENDYTVQIDLPTAFSFTASAKMYTVSGSDFSTFDAVLDSSDITLSDSLLVKVPKHSMVLIKFVGDNKNFTKLPLGHYTYTKPTALKTKLISPSAEITENKGEVKLTHEFTPANVDFNLVKWDIVSNPINATMFVSGNEVTVRATGKNNGNGSITIKVTSIENPKLTDMITINVSGQSISNNYVPDITAYPNPVENMLTLTSSDEDIEQIDVINSMGATILSIKCSEKQKQVSMNTLSSGVYFVKVKTKDGVKTIRILKN